MKLLIDSREKWTQPNSADKHIKDYFDRHGIEYEVRKLDVGDYQIDGQANISVDRKQNLDEVARNLLNRNDHARFWREVRRAREQGVKLIILVEHGGQIHSIKDVAKWKSKYSQVSGRRLMDEMYRTHISYGIEWIFCSKRSTGRRIIELLSGDADA